MVGNTLSNEYEENSRIISGAFPMLFPIGVIHEMLKGYGSVKTVTTRRLLTFGDQRFANTRDQCNVNT